MRTAVSSMTVSISELQGILYGEGFIGSADTKAKEDGDVETLAKKMESVSVSSTPAKGKPVDVRKWFDTCFEQITKLSQTIVISLDDESKNT